MYVYICTWLVNIARGQYANILLIDICIYVMYINELVCKALHTYSFPSKPHTPCVYMHFCVKQYAPINLPYTHTAPALQVPPPLQAAGIHFFYWITLLIYTQVIGHLYWVALLYAQIYCPFVLIFVAYTNILDPMSHYIFSIRTFSPAFQHITTYHNRTLSTQYVQCSLPKLPPLWSLQPQV